MINLWPYTNPHELNLDWVIATVVKCVNEFNALEKDFTELKTYVDDYFKNLDLTAEVDVAIQELVNNGTMERLAEQALQGWLTDGTMQGLVDNSVQDLVTPAVNAANEAASKANTATTAATNAASAATSAATTANEAATNATTTANAAASTANSAASNANTAAANANGAVTNLENYLFINPKITTLSTQTFTSNDGNSVDVTPVCINGAWYLKIKSGVKAPVLECRAQGSAPTDWQPLFDYISTFGYYAILWFSYPESASNTISYQGFIYATAWTNSVIAFSNAPANTTYSAPLSFAFRG